MPLNQLLHDEQVAMLRAAGANTWRAAEGHRNRLAGLDDKISSYVFRNRGIAVGRDPKGDADLSPKVKLVIELAADHLAGVDHWASVWGIPREAAVRRLIARGIGETSHLMRSS